VHVGSDNVDSVGVGEGRVGAFPGCYAAAAGAQGDGGAFDPSSAEAVEEVGLASYFAALDVCISEFAYVDLAGISMGVVEWRERGLLYLGSCRIRCNKILHSHS
jgi:hypothetical protein